MGCPSGCGKSKVKYQVKVDGRPVAKPVDSIAAAHSLGKSSSSGAQKYTIQAVNP